MNGALISFDWSTPHFYVANGPVLCSPLDRLRFEICSTLARLLLGTCSALARFRFAGGNKYSSPPISEGAAQALQENRCE